MRDAKRVMKAGPDGGYGLKVNLTRPPAAGEAPPDPMDDVPVWFDIVDRIISQPA